MPDGTKFNGPRELSQVFANDPRFRPCLSGALLTYALGRSLRRDSDRPYLATYRWRGSLRGVAEEC